MNTFFEHIAKLKDAIKLSVNRKAEIRETLSHMIDADLLAREGKKSHRTIGQLVFARFGVRSMSFAAIFGIVVLTVGGVASAAEQSLPGDLLYPMKVGINEEVRAQFALSDQAKAEWQTRRVERRLEETEELRAKGMLSANQEAQVDVLFEKQTRTAKAKITQLEHAGNIEEAATVASRLEGALEVHEQVLLSLGSGAQVKPEQIAAQVNKAKIEITALRMGLESRVGEGRGSDDKKEIAATSKLAPSVLQEPKKIEKGNEAAEGKLRAATNVVISAERHFEENKSDLNAEAIMGAEARLNFAKETIKAGETSVAKGKYRNAFILGNQAIRIAEESRTFVNAKSKWNVTIHRTSSSETMESLDVTTEVDLRDDESIPPRKIEIGPAKEGDDN